MSAALKLIVYQPHLISINEKCSNCGKSQEVFALASPGIFDFSEGEEICTPESPFLVVLCFIKKVPKHLLNIIHRYQPNYKKHGSDLNGLYYANYCECGCAFDDRDLHERPGGGFTPVCLEEAPVVIVRRVPIESVSLKGNYTQGGIDILFSKAKWEKTLRIGFNSNGQVVEQYGH